MNYCFIISNARLDYFNIQKVKKETSNVEFILIYQKEGKSIPSEDFIGHMDHIFALNNITLESCSEVIASFIDNSTKASIVCTDEIHLLTCARLREKFKLRGARAYQYMRFLDKILMKQILNINYIKVPKFMCVDFNYVGNFFEEYHQFITSHLKVPYIIKPNDGGASESVAAINSSQDLINWYKNNYQPDRVFEVEEYITGDFFMCDSFVIDGKIIFCTPSQYIYPCLDFLSGKIMGLFPLPSQDPMFETIMKFNKRVVKALQPPNGSLHMEFFIKNGKITFIEIGARPPGKATCLLHEKNYNVNLYELTLRETLGLPIMLDVKENLYHGWFGFSTYPNKVNILHMPNLKSKLDLEWKIKVNDIISKFPLSINEGMSAEMVLYNPNFQEFMMDIETLKSFKPYS